MKYINSEDAIDNTSDYEVSDMAERDSVETRMDSSKNNRPSNPITHKTRRDINLRLRFKVMARDNFKCCKCGRSPATDPTVILHVDHKYPWVKGGETTMENLETTCMECNIGKGDLVFEE